MKTEFECRIPKIDKKQIRSKLRFLKAKLVKKEFLQKRYILDNQFLRAEGEQWIRLRDEDGKITMTYKSIVRNKIDGAKEIEVSVDNLENTRELLQKIGLKVKRFEENYREIWKLGNCTLTIDSWPMIDPILEIEGGNEKDVWKVLKLLGYSKNDCMFGNITDVYKTYRIEVLKMDELKF